MSNDLYIGLMSGTSMDGLDAVLVDFSGARPQLLRHLDTPLPDALRSELIQLCSPGHNELHRQATADRQFAELSAELVLRILQHSDVTADQVQAIGSHGQTVRHMPDALTPYTVQLGDPNTLAALTGIAVVADFRRKDMALGGQGAPLVPAFHDALFRQQLQGTNSAAVLNLGGIANITVLEQASSQVYGFDTGPANTLLDLWFRMQHPDAEHDYDKSGAFAAQGEVIDALLEAMMADPYVQQPAPKSTGREYFNYGWLEQHLKALEKWRGADIQATLAEFTARSVAQGLASGPNPVEKVFVAGGGAFNQDLMARLARNYPAASWTTVKELGIDPQHLEAMAFAWLARQFMRRQPGNLPAVTGASRATVLGGLYLP
ncbi:anhydro-N-acetylmuramic acid kinase [Pseudidiomarina insulisalsae]|uniref:Anhydro-N-acetylmuramic acid kinase n=1 Tax=Pseudidiomarina insulisalsae TaxID=575789 RepID=A0A432YA16_9GAMM|nr:anhydro-N-acetylmuramic acid kinase [Pseudidiomarina insulisalsae]RUO57820.1 anhydro-N-acetylmuramic acid kinase [Pseudidiomarina insulisalsae]